MVVQSRFTLTIATISILNIFLSKVEFQLFGFSFERAWDYFYMICLFALLFIFFKKGNKHSQVSGYTDEYLMSIDRQSKAWAFLALIFVLVTQIIITPFIFFEIPQKDLLFFNLWVCLLLYAARITWLLYKDNQEEQYE